MRIFLGFLVAGLAIAAAVWLYGAEFQHWPGYCRGVVPGDASARVPCDGSAGRVTGSVQPRQPTKADWQNPAAVLLVFAGLGAGAALVVRGARR
jgi:hypothetical protein